MSEQILSRINEYLNEEKWTRAARSEHSISSFELLDAAIEEVTEAGVQNEVLRLCDGHLEASRDSIIALYLSGIIALGRRLVDDSNLIVLVNMFIEHERWNIVQHLCERILSYGENKFALRTLADTYAKKDEPERQFDVWERLIKVDFEDADTVKALAEKRYQEGDLDGALIYHKKALHRYINRRQFSQVRLMWDKVIEFQHEDLEGLLQVEAKAVRALGGVRAVTLLEALYPYYSEREAWDSSIVILKRILSHDPKNNGARSELVAAYTKRYAGHSHLDEYVKISNLTQSWRNVYDAISDFEKHISFDVGNYVFHRSWGLGRIKEIKDDVFVIDFLKKRNHRMSLKMAVSALNILGNEHIWVLRATVPRHKLTARVKEDPAWALRIVIKSLGNAADMKRVKAELTPRILSQNEWSKWSTTARRILKTDPSFGTRGGKSEEYTVRDSPISFEEKTFNKFRSDPTFFDRIQTLDDFLSHAQPDSEYLAEMFQYFAGFLKASTGQIENTLASFLIVERLMRRYPFLDPGVRLMFEPLFGEIEDFEQVYETLEAAGLAAEFLGHVRAEIPAWPQVFARVFLFRPASHLIDELHGAGQADVIGNLISGIVDDYRDHRQPFVWLVRNDVDSRLLKSQSVKEEKVMIGMIHLLDLTYRDISNKREVAVNRKLNRQIFDYLFKEARLTSFIADANEESITRIYTLVEDVKELDPSIKIRVRQRIKEKFPAYQFAEEAEHHSVRMGLLVTRMGYEERQRELRHLLEVDIPENSKEIGLALQQGDLRENAEYKAALEKQEHLKNAVSRLQEDLQNAQIFDLSEVNASRISFGTRVTLTNIDSNAAEEYVILGPWESNPERHVISYLSPLGAELWDHRTNDELQFTINKKDFHYRIDRIGKVAGLETVTA